jgi:hypothetical protein
VLGTGASPAAFTLVEKRDDHSGATVPAGLLPYRVHVYFVSPCDIPTTGHICNGTDDDGGRPISTLKRLELATDVGGNPVMRTVPLVEGIQDLQVDYGIDQPAPGAGVGDGSPDAYTTAPATPADGERGRGATYRCRRWPPGTPTESATTSAWRESSGVRRHQAPRHPRWCASTTSAVPEAMTMVLSFRPMQVPPAAVPFCSSR